MKVHCVWEHNGNDTLLYADNFPGAYARGESREVALSKMPGEIRVYRSWIGTAVIDPLEIAIVQEKKSELNIRDADSDVLFDSEQSSLTMEEYRELKTLALKSAEDFLRLYLEIPDKSQTVLLPRETFYGKVPTTAEEMYQHTKNVNSYYFGEIDVPADNEGSIVECRARGFGTLEQVPGFLTKLPCEGSYGEIWSLRKVLRRFVWHDRIHAKAMYRMAVKTFGKENIPDIFRFEER